MKRAVVVTCLVLLSARAAWAGSGREQLQSAIGTVLADTLPDAAEVTDRLGFVHRVYADTGGLWYQTNETGPDGSPAIRIAEAGANSPFSFVTCDSEFGWTLTVVWLEKSDRRMAVCCRRRALVQPFWVWSMPRDVTPQRRGWP